MCLYVVDAQDKADKQEQASCQKESGSLVFTAPRTFRETAHFFIGIAGNAEQAYRGKEYAEPAQAKNDP